MIQSNAIQNWINAHGFVQISRRFWRWFVKRFVRWRKPRLVRVKTFSWLVRSRWWLFEFVVLDQFIRYYLTEFVANKYRCFSSISIKLVKMEISFSYIIICINKIYFWPTYGLLALVVPAFGVLGDFALNELATFSI